MKNDLRLFGTLFVFLLIVCAHSAAASAIDTNKNATLGITADQDPFQKSPLDNTPISGQFTINQNEPTGGTNFNSFNDLKDRLIASGVNGPLMVDVVGNNAVYEEQLIFLSVSGASQTNNITINGNGNTLQFLSTNSNERATLKLNGAKFFTFNNLIIKALGEQSGEYGYGVHLMFGADHNSFIGCHIVANETSTSEDFMGIVASNNHSYHTMPGETAQYLLIDNCVVKGGRIGLALNGNNYPHFNYLTVTNTHVKNFHEIGIYLNYQKGAIISNNSIYRDSSRSIRGTRMIFLDRNLSGSRITNNRIFGFSGTLEQNQSFEARGISTNWLTSDISNRLVIANNLIYGFGKMSSWQFGIHIHGNNARIYHNSISLDSEALFSGGTLTGIYLEGGPANMDIRNNIIRVASLGVTNNYGFYFQSTSSIDHCNHNAIFVSGPNAHVAKVNHYYNYTTLSDWQTVSGLDLNSVFADPFFVQNPPLLPLNELINNIGADLLSSVPLDIEGNPRTTTPDPGAREFNPGCIPPVALSGVAVFESGVGAAVLSWTPQGEEDAWNIEYGPAGFVLGSGNSISVSENPYTLSGLQPLTNYDFYVQAVCEEGSTSAWAGPASFTTLAGQEEVACPPDVEICELNDPIALAGASPQGGTWSGNGVSGNLFSPAVAGPGVHTITYTFGQGSCEFTITVFEALPVSVSIVSSHSEICEGNLVAFTATPVNGGGSPAYQWMVNGNNAGTNSPGFSYAPENEDQISVLLTSSEACVSGNPSSSNTLTMTVHENPIVSWTWEQESVCIGVSQLQLTGGTPEGGSYSGPGVEAEQFYPSMAGVGIHTLTYTYTSEQGCSRMAQAVIEVQDCTNAGQQQIGNAFFLYPNPASNKLYLQSDIRPGDLLQILVYDVHGNLVILQDKPDPNKTHVLDVGHLSKGVYIIHLKCRSMLLSGKFVVM